MNYIKEENLAYNLHLIKTKKFKKNCIRIIETGYAGIALQMWGHADPDGEREKLDNPVEIKKLASVIEGESISEIESTNISDLQETTIVETLQDASSTPEILETKTEEIIDEAPKKSEDLESESTVANVDDVINSLPLLDFIDEPEEKVLEKQK